MTTEVIRYRTGATEVAQQTAPIPGALPAERHSTILLQLISTLLRHKWVILAMGVAGLLCGLAITLLTPPTYRANVRLAFDAGTGSVLHKDDDAGSTADPLMDFTAVGLLQARSLADRVARALNLADMPTFVDQKLPRDKRQRIASAMVLNGTEVVQQRQTRLVDVYFKARDPQITALVSNSLADNFIQSTIDRKLDQSSFARKYLHQQLESTRKTLEESERKLVEFERVEGMVTIQSKGEDGKSTSQSLNNAELSDIAAQLVTAQQHRIAAEQKYRSLVNIPASINNPAGLSLQTELSQQRAQVAELSQTYKADYPELAAARNRITILEQELARSNNNGKQSIEAEYRAAAGEEQALRDRLDQLRNSVLSERASSTEYTVLTRDVDTNRALYDALLQRFKEVGVVGNVGDSNVSVLDRAQVPSAPITPVLPVNLAIGLLAGLFFGVLGSLGYDMLRDVISSPSDVEDHLGMKSVGAIPFDDEHPSIAAALADPRSYITEAYFSVANLLRFATAHGIPKTLMLTSTMPQEGKSSSTFGIARSIARMGKRVLIIDADLRRPTFRKTQDRYEGKGLVDLLTDNATLDEVVMLGEYGIYYILAGGTPPNPSELFASGKIAGIIEELSLQFDIVILDAPPILGYVDAPVLASFVEGTIIVFESGRIRTRYAQSSVHKLRSAGGHLVGGLITKFQKKHDDYGYGYGYGYGDGYGEQSSLDDAESQRRSIVLSGPSGTI